MEQDTDKEVEEVCKEMVIMIDQLKTHCRHDRPERMT